MKNKIFRIASLFLIISALLCLSLLTGCDSQDVREHACYTNGAPQNVEWQSPTCRSEGVLSPRYICDVCGKIFGHGMNVDLPRTAHNMKDGYCTDCGGFESSTGLEFEPSEDGSGYTLVGLGSFSGEMPTVDIYNGLCVTGIKDGLAIERITLGPTAANSGAFKANTTLKELTIILDYNGTFISRNAFSDCTSLEKLDFISAPHGVVAEEEAEEGSDASEETFEFIPYSLYVLEEAFQNCTSLKTVALPMTKVYFYSRSFADCSSLESVAPTDAIYGIKGDSFVGCLLLEPMQIEGH